MKLLKSGLMRAMVNQMPKQNSRSSSNNPRTAHVGKSSAERKYYTKAIKELRIQPTLDESLDFQESDDVSPDFTVPESTKKRRISLKYQLKEHVIENWYYWIPTILVTMVVPWFFNKFSDHNDRLIKTETRLEYTQKSIDEVKSDIKELSGMITSEANPKRKNKVIR